MRAITIWLIVLTVLMLISFVISGIFFLGSGLINVDTGEVHQEKVDDIEVFSYEVERFFVSEEARNTTSEQYRNLG